MGKDSLIKSTSKKKSSSTKKDEDSGNVEAEKAKAAKKTAPKSPKKAKPTPKKAKSAVKSKTTGPAKAKTPKKSKAVSKPKTAVKAKAATKPKAAAEKTAAEKAAAEKAAAEKAAAEKAATEKAAAEKAATEKAAAEKAAAEKTAAEKAAKEPIPSISYEPPPDNTKPSDPSGRMMQIGIGALALLILLIIGASFLNHRHYYIMPGDGAIEIWQGMFAPKGTSLLISLPGRTHDAPAKQEYTQQEVFPLIFGYYRDKAAMLMDVKGMPDFNAEKAYLEKALCYSTTAEEKTVVNSRINTIDLMVLMSKADAAISKKTVASLETALEHLREAADLDLDDIQEEQVKRQTASAKAILKKLKQQEAEATEAAQKAILAEAKAKKAQAEKMKTDAKAAKDREKAKKTETKPNDAETEKSQE